jgi:hypothetical protein
MYDYLYAYVSCEPPASVRWTYSNINVRSGAATRDVTRHHRLLSHPHPSPLLLLNSLG